MKKVGLLSLALLAVAVLTGCADVTNVEPCLLGSEPVGFWYGVWHGMIAQFAFIGSLFSNNIAIYAVNNNGAWYDFGYVGGLGIMIKLISLIIKGLKD